MSLLHYHKTINVITHGRGTYSITDKVETVCKESQIIQGLCVLFIRHTSASLIIYENSDPTARVDLHNFFNHLVPENTNYAHNLEGSDDATSHLKMALTRSSETIPIINGKLSLGTWQGIYLFEHRDLKHRREVVVSILGFA
jgi:secondary thiamine-phosphate synthase enzyme